MSSDAPNFGDITPTISDDSGTDTPDHDHSFLSEAVDIKSWDECKDYKMPLGKHLGQCISELMTVDGLDYLQYLAKWDELEKHTGSYVKFALAHGLKTVKVDPIEANTWIMPFGKFKGKPLCKIAAHKKGPGYIKWLTKLSSPGISLRAKAIYKTLSDDPSHEPQLFTPMVKVKRSKRRRKRKPSRWSDAPQ